MTLSGVLLVLSSAAAFTPPPLPAHLSAQSVSGKGQPLLVALTEEEVLTSTKEMDRQQATAFSAVLEVRGEQLAAPAREAQALHAEERAREPFAAGYADMKLARRGTSGRHFSGILRDADRNFNTALHWSTTTELRHAISEAKAELMETKRADLALLEATLIKTKQVLRAFKP